MRNLIVVLIGCLLPTFASAKTPDSEWSNLERVTWKRPYTFVLRDQTCVPGQIVSVTDDGVTLEGRPDPLKRAGVLRVFEGSDVNDLVYSGRNSFTDIEGIHPGEGEYIEVVLKDGSDYRTDPKLTVHGHPIEKEKVLRVYYVRKKPLLENGKTDIPKKYYIYPEVWPRIHPNARMLAVLLYDSGMPEDDGPIQCRAR